MSTGSRNVRPQRSRRHEKNRGAGMAELPPAQPFLELDSLVGKDLRAQEANLQLVIAELAHDGVNACRQRLDEIGQEIRIVDSNAHAAEPSERALRQLQQQTLIIAAQTHLRHPSNGRAATVGLDCPSEASAPWASAL